MNMNSWVFDYGLVMNMNSQEQVVFMNMNSQKLLYSSLFIVNRALFMNSLGQNPCTSLGRCPPVESPLLVSPHVAPHASAAVYRWDCGVVPVRSVQHQVHALP